jgi:hypothetical protein
MLPLTLLLAATYDGPETHFDKFRDGVCHGGTLLRFQGDEPFSKVSRIQELVIPMISLDPIAFGKIITSLPGLRVFLQSLVEPQWSSKPDMTDFRACMSPIGAGSMRTYRSNLVTDFLVPFLLTPLQC